MAIAVIEKNAPTAAASLLRSMGATQVFIFGSATKGRLRTDSDIDLVDSDDPTPLVISRRRSVWAVDPAHVPGRHEPTEGDRYFLTGAAWSSAMFNFRTLTRGSPRMPNWRSSVCEATI